MTDQWSDEQPDDRQYADQRDFYKVEKWSRDGMRIEQMLYTDSSPAKCRLFSPPRSNTGRVSS